MNSNVIDIEDFLEVIPPGVTRFIARNSPVLGGFYPQLTFSDLELHCGSEFCKGVRYFEPEVSYVEIKKQRFFIAYSCRNCSETIKTYALEMDLNEKNEMTIRKYGEFPDFGAPIPPKALSLVGGERELFLKGRRCENQGLGVAAFVYYRRVIESQKERIFNRVIQVVKAISPNDEIISELESAKKESQFTKAIDSIKHTLPQSLLINGQNPLKLIYSALSKGVHNHSDEECLDLAAAVRTVLFNLAERLDVMMKDEKELNEAIKLLAVKGK